MNIKGALVIVTLALVVAACVPAEPTQELPPSPTATATLLPTAVSVPTDTPAPIPTPPPPDLTPQRREFEVADGGGTIVGYFYPAAVPDAPLIILMHWARGDQTDWTTVGLVEWLQNAGAQQAGNRPIPVAFRPSIYQPLPLEVSFNVLTFDFRGFGESDALPPSADAGEAWSDDIVTVVQVVEGEHLPGSDRLGCLGSSIGADGAAICCLNSVGACKGLFSLSPGGYLNIPYEDLLAAIYGSGQSTPYAYCLSSEEDVPSAFSCKEAEQVAPAEYYKAIFYPGGLHGTEFLFPETAPEDIGQHLYDWLRASFGFSG